jgi:hypothetical protein
MGDLIKKTKIVPFINTGTAQNPVWTQIKKSTSFTLAMNPQTKTFDFISSETPQNEIDSYQPSLAQSLTMFKGEPDYEAIFDMLFARATGADAHRDTLICFYKEQGSTAGTVSYVDTSDVAIDPDKTYYTKSGDVYTAVDIPVLEDIDEYYEKVESGGTAVFKAWKIDALVTLNQLDSVNESIDFDLALNEITNGAVSVSAQGAPIFTKGTWSGTTFTPDAE